LNERSMNKEDISQDIIDRYIWNELSEKERSDFEMIMAEDDSLRNEVELTRYIARGFERSEEQNALDEMLTLPKEQVLSIIYGKHTKPVLQKQPEFDYSDSRQIRRKRTGHNKKTFSVTSAVAAAIVIILIYIGFQPQYSSRELFDEYYSEQTYEKNPVRGGYNLTEEQEEYFIQGIGYYKQKDYSKALNIFNKAATGLKPDQIPEEFSFYFAVSLINNNQPDKALEHLHYLSSIKNPFRRDALWYTSLAYLQLEQTDKAKELLNEISNDPDNRYASDAKRLVEKLNKRKWF